MRTQWRAPLLCQAALVMILPGCEDDSQKHWGALEQCLVGEPIKPNENAFTRLRGVELAESLKATGTKEDWPGRCAVHATALHAALDDGGKLGMVKRALAEQLGCDNGCVFPEQGHVLPAADKLWEAAQRAELKSESPADVPKPAAPVTPRGAQQWPAIGHGLHAARTFKKDALYLLFKGQEGLSYCTVQGEKASCKKAGAAPGFRQEGSLTFLSDTATPVAVGSLFSEAAGLTRTGFSLLEEKTLAVFGEEGHETNHGFTFLQKEDATEPSPDAPPAPAKLEVLRVEEGKVRGQSSLTLSARVRGPEIVHDQLVYVDRDAQQKPRFVARKLQKAGSPLGPGATEYPGEFPGLFNACSSEGGAAIGAFSRPIRRLGKAASGKATLTAVILQGDDWQAPVTTEIPQEVGQLSEWRCGDGWGGLSWIEQQGTDLAITDLTCTSSGCKSEKTEWREPSLKNVLALEHLGEDTVLVYQAKPGDTRVKIGKAKSLATTPASLAFEAEAFGGVELKNLQLVPTPKGLYLILEGGELRALLFSGGNVTPVTT